ncbi:MAG: hypothetical protein HC884_15920 [Chloroflexaceae bacterium]|nr:hypothetical protein [Chloroflexaceae bacterium]
MNTSLLNAPKRWLTRRLQRVRAFLASLSPGGLVSLHRSATFAEAERAALVRGAILVTHLFVALAIAVMLAGHFPRPPDDGDAAQADLREQEEVVAADTARLNSYGWIDRESDVVHIPIREAIERTVSEGAAVGRQARLVERGQALFHGLESAPHPNFRPCTTCHYFQADRGVLVGPNMSGVADRAGSRVPGLSASDYLRQSIVTHDAFVVEGFEAGVMLSIVGEDFGTMLPAEDIDALVAYLLTLHEGSTDGPSSPTAPADLAAAATPEPETLQEVAIGTGEAVVPDASGLVVVEEGGYAFRLPEGWQALAFHGRVAVRPIGDESVGRTGPVIAMASGTLSDLNIPNVSTSTLTVTDTFFQVISETIRQETAGVMLHDIGVWNLREAPGQVATLQGNGFGDIEGDVFGRFAIALVDQSHVFVLMGLASPPDAWDADAAFAAILQSVRLAREGEELPVGGDEEPNPLLPFPPGSSPLPPHSPLAPDRAKGPRFSCVHCHVTHEVEMLHDSNPSCVTCHSGTSYQRHCVDCHSIHGVRIPHRPQNPSCANCHPQGIPGGEGVDVQLALITFLSYFFHEI